MRVSEIEKNGQRKNEHFLRQIETRERERERERLRKIVRKKENGQKSMSIYHEI